MINKAIMYGKLEFTARNVKLKKVDKRKRRAWGCIP